MKMMLSLKNGVLKTDIKLGLGLQFELINEHLGDIKSRDVPHLLINHAHARTHTSAPGAYTHIARARKHRHLQVLFGGIRSRDAEVISSPVEEDNWS